MSLQLLSDEACEAAEHHEAEDEEGQDHSQYLVLLIDTKPLVFLHLIKVIIQHKIEYLFIVQTRLAVDRVKP